MARITQKQIADCLGVCPATVQHILSCYRHGSYWVAKKLADTTDTDIEMWVKDGTGTPENRRAAFDSWAKGDHTSS